MTVRTPEDFPAVSRLHVRWLPLVYPWAVWRWLRRNGRAFDVAIGHSYVGWLTSFWRGRPFRMVTAFHGLEPLFYRELAIDMRREGRPLRWPFRGLHGWLVPQMCRASCRRSDAVFCLNRAEAAYLARHRWAVPDRVAVVPHGVPAAFFIDREPRPAARVLLFVGQWLPTKGTRELAEAFTAVASRRPGIRLWCAGTIRDEASVRSAFPDWVRPQVDVFPRLDQGELVDRYRQADVFVFPSHFEGFGRVLLEAMAAALPIVTTPVGAAADLLTPDADAVLVPLRDSGALVVALERLVEDPDLRARLGQAAQARARGFELPRVNAAKARRLEDVARVRF